MYRILALTLSILTLVGLAPLSAAAEPHPASRDPAKAPAGLYVLDKNHASLTMRLSHMGMSGFTLRFDSFDAHYTYDPANPDASKIEVSIDAGSLNVGDPKVGPKFAREFLDAEASPKITFASTGIQRAAVTETGGPVTGTVTGDLTFRGVTKPVTLQVTFNGTGPGLLGGHRMGFSATTDIKRSDFGSHQYESMVGDDVHLAIEVEFQRK
jgi:polyisoprenoid-binding protein YceI